MIISNSKCFIFVHIPKCGGTTISSLLEKRLLPQDVSLNTNRHFDWDRYRQAYKDRFNLFKHSTSEQIAKAIKPSHFSRYFVFSFTRNPFARAYSCFRFTKKTDSAHRPNSQRYQEIKSMEFKDFLKSDYMQQKQLLASKDQVSWIMGSPSVVKTYKLEEIQSKFPGIWQKLYGNNTPCPKITVSNKSSNDPSAWQSMSNVEAELCRELYADDFKTFDYPLELITS